MIYKFNKNNNLLHRNQIKLNQFHHMFVRVDYVSVERYAYVVVRHNHANELVSFELHVVFYLIFVQLIDDANELVNE
jgi:hypothetical protein